MSLMDQDEIDACVRAAQCDTCEEAIPHVVKAQHARDAARIEVRREDDAKMTERRDADHAQTIEMCGASDARKDAEIAQLREALGEACEGWRGRLWETRDEDASELAHIAALRARFGSGEGENGR